MTRLVSRRYGLLAVAAAALGASALCGLRTPPAPVAARPVGKATPLPAAPAPEPADDTPADPGKVKWHGSFDEACAAAAKSGKPVLLFSMMGRLDRRHC